jgi:hypothetical protein
VSIPDWAKHSVAHYYLSCFTVSLYLLLNMLIVHPLNIFSVLRESRQGQSFKTPGHCSTNLKA